ncbi:purine permease [Georgenia satyanarayanai]|uniref:uracil-xanthine permease family protein n=1 Tax=Georgenia satyanarayanai TaxID=860221 RepID=UPI00203BAD37|nr:nucleobase:cation symporter-2 family protein [Georgenia satyanarayanai]MCM3660616.1 purine permease [Georgenia satyanarayanai]
MSKRKVQVDAASAASPVHPVDEVPPLRRAVPLALQHVVIAYGGLITTPIVVGGAIGLDTPALAALIAANLVVAGLVTLVQTLGIWKIGVRYPVVMGSTFTAIGPSIMIGNEYGLPALFGGTILAGVMTVVIAPFFAKLLRYFPPVVTGTIIGIIGISLLPTSANLIQGEEGSPGYNTVSSFVLAAITVGIVLAVDRFGRRTFKQVSILLALVLGTVIAVFMGKADFSTVGESGVLSVPSLFGGLGAPTFVLAAIVPLLIVQFVNMIESTGDTMAIGEIIGKDTGEKEISRTLLADGVGTAVGGIFTPFSLVTFANNVGLIQITRMFSRYVVALAGVFLILFGLIAPLGDMAAALPAPVLGGITVVMFGTIGVVGMRIIAKDDLSDSRNIFIVGISFGFGIIPVGAPDFWSGFPDILQPVLSTSIAAGGISAFVLNLVLKVWGSKKEDEARENAVAEV